MPHGQVKLDFLKQMVMMFHIMPVILMMPNISTNSKPEMTTMVDTQLCRTTIFNLQWSQPVMLPGLESLVSLKPMMMFPIMLVILMMPNTSINLKPEMITMVDIQL